MDQKPNKDLKNKNNEDFNWNRVFKIVLGWSIILIGFFLIMIYTKSSDGKHVDVTFDQYQKFLTDKKIESATLKKSDNNYELFGKLRNPETVVVAGKSITVDKFSIYLPYTNVDDALIKSWNENIPTFSVEKDENSKRDEIHILLAGDPGTDKSQILKRIESLNFKAGHAVGGGTSEAGILGVAIRDEITGSWSIEPGLMPMCNDGIIAFDELDKTHHILLGKLNEAMEQQTVTITKAGSSITYPCRTLVLAALNPKNGHFDSYKGVREQIQLPDSVLDRFDLIYILQDIPNEKKDGEIVRSFGGYESIKDNLKPGNVIFISHASFLIKTVKV